MFFCGGGGLVGFFFWGGLFNLLLTDYKTLFLIYQLLGHLDEDILFYFLIYINVNILKIGKWFGKWHEHPRTTPGKGRGYIYLGLG